MNFRLLAVAAGAASLCAGAALAAEPVATSPGFYGQLSLGSGIGGRTKLSSPGDSLHEGLNAGLFASAAVGRSLEGGVAFETEILYLHNDIDTGDLDRLTGVNLGASVRTTGLLVNAHYAVAPVGPFTASVGAGAGYGEAKYKLLGGSESKGGFMWQAMAGLSYPVSDKLSWDLQYRYVRSPRFHESVDAGTLGVIPFKVETGTHVLAVGARMKF